MTRNVILWYEGMIGPCLITFLSHWCISLPVGYVLSSTELVSDKMNAAGWWYGLGLGLTIGFIASIIRLSVIFNRVKKSLKAS